MVVKRAVESIVNSKNRIYRPLKLKSSALFSGVHYISSSPSLPFPPIAKQKNASNLPFMYMAMTQDALFINSYHKK